MKSISDFYCTEDGFDFSCISTLAETFALDFSKKVPISPSFVPMKSEISNNNENPLSDETKIVQNFNTDPDIVTSNCHNLFEDVDEKDDLLMQPGGFDRLDDKYWSSIRPPLNLPFDEVNSVVAVKSEFMEDDQEEKKEKVIQDNETIRYNTRSRDIEESESIDSGMKPREGRWGKADDRKLYQLLLRLESINTIKITELLQDVQNADTKKHKQVLRFIANKIMWNSSNKLLLNRIKKIMNENEFSVREMHYLKRIIRKEFKFANLDYNSIAQRFPGKSMALIIDMCNKIVERFKPKNLKAKSSCPKILN